MGIAKPSQVHILFPIISEDPFAFERKASQLGAALPGLWLEVEGREGGKGQGGHGGQHHGLATEGGTNAATQQQQQYPQSGVESTATAMTITAASRGGGVQEEATASSLWEDFPLKLRVVASRRFSEHMLLKITDARHHDLGEAIVPIRLALPHVADAFYSQQQQQQQEPKQEDGASNSNNRKHRYQFALSSGGEFRGYLSMDLNVRHRPLSSGEFPVGGGEKEGSKG